MIHNKDRSGWFGASDTAIIMGSWDTKTFRLWWLEKLGLRHNGFTNIAMQTGTAFEHRILKAAGITKMDRQIKKRKLRLRVNLDGETPQRIFEVKTYGGDVFKISRAYWMQAQVEFFAGGKPVSILAYRLEPEDYQNWLRPIDKKRMSRHPIEADEGWLRDAYLPRLFFLAEALKKGVFPDEKPGGDGKGAHRRV